MSLQLVAVAVEPSTSAAVAVAVEPPSEVSH
jgi:hypothetical protein